MVHCQEVMCHAETLVHFLQCQGHSKGLINQNAVPFATRLSLLVLHHKPQCPVEKIGLLHSRSRSQQWFKMSVNICLDDIFWTAKHFVTKCGVVQHHKPECSVKNWITVIKVKITAKGQNVSVCPDDICYTDKHFVTKLGIMMHHHELECHAKRLVCYF